MSKRPHRRRDHRPAPTAEAHECAFQPCVLPQRWCVAGVVEVEPGQVVIGLAMVCELHRPESLRELGQVVEPICEPIERAAQVIAHVEEVHRRVS